MPADTPPISEHQLCSTPSLCSTLVARLRTILKSNGPRHAATASIPRLSNLRDQFSASRALGDDGRRYIGIPKPKRISNVYVSSFIVDFVLLVFSKRTSFCLSIFARRWSDFSPKQHAQLRMSRV
ncbi:hypothetical protein ALC60_03583 [Trachymyrmex zeteki]|uniref:Uncharacterized protein n=1 Tax=Mycetomoellerius zeteki TaxID=64791 RepID=A0A151XB68_9HYME|nr:hypothetical protein ALC60_03583 [Trachymyrmex zeteki]